VRDAFRQEFDIAAVLTNDTDLVEPMRIVTRELGMYAILFWCLAGGRSRSPRAGEVDSRFTLSSAQILSDCRIPRIALRESTTVLLAAGLNISTNQSDQMVGCRRLIHIEADHQTIIGACFIHGGNTRFSREFEPLLSGHSTERNEREALATPWRSIAEHCGVGRGI